MFIELHQMEDGLPVLLHNADRLVLVTQCKGDSFSTVYLDTDHYIKVKESYNEIKAMLTDRLVAKRTEDNLGMEMPDTDGEYIEGLCCDCVMEGPCCLWYGNESCPKWKKDGSCWVSLAEGGK